MATDEIISKTNKLVQEHLGVDPEKIVADARFEDLGADSLDMVELVMAFEEEFGIEITDDEGANVETVQQAYDLLTAKLA